MANYHPKQNPKFLEYKIPENPDYVLSKRPYCVRLPIELDELLRGTPGATVEVREILVNAWKQGAFDRQQGES